MSKLKLAKAGTEAWKQQQFLCYLCINIESLEDHLNRLIVCINAESLGEYFLRFIMCINVESLEDYLL
jgi:hypothetical protein